MRAQLIRKWNSFPGGRSLHKGNPLLSPAVLNSPTRPLGHIEGHLQYQPPPPATLPPFSCSLSLLSSRSRGLICARVSFDPHTRILFLQMQTLQYFLLIGWDEITGYCACLSCLMTERARTPPSPGSARRVVGAHTHRANGMKRGSLFRCERENSKGTIPN